METDALDSRPFTHRWNTALRLEQETLHLQDLEASLMEEWASLEDEEAFADL